MPKVPFRSRRVRRGSGGQGFGLPIEVLEPRQLLAVDLVISEFMASNRSTLADVDGDYSDWIEIQNRGTTAANLLGWHLTDDDGNLTKWTFPSQPLAAGGYVVVFASSKDRGVSGQELHTNFNLNASGDYLALVAPDGVTVQHEYAPEYPSQTTDMSYGIGTAVDDPVYFTTPTPGKANQLISATPKFSVAGGTFVDTFTLVLTSSNPSAVIRYTTDRSSPRSTSKRYTGPITISSTTVVRARCYTSNLAAGAIVSEAYIALDSTVSSFRSNLPVVVVDSFGRGLNDTSLTYSSAVFIDTGDDGYADFLDAADFCGPGGVRYRGQSSQGFPKIAYALETWDESNKDKSVSILGMPSESDWILYNPYSEKSLMQNYLAYEWANRMGQYAVRTRYVELFVNLNGDSKINYASDYVGVYIFMEKIKRDSDRVDIAPLTPQDNTEPDVTGGYIFKKDKFDGTPDEKSFTTSRGQTLLYVEPKGNEITTAQQAYLTGYINAFEAALYGSNFKDPVEGYAKYIDVDSFIDNWILVEMTKNIDGFRLSTYFYKDRGGKIVMGPIWDYNLSLGNADYYGGQNPVGWYSDQLSDTDYPYFRRLLQDPDFKQKLVDRWHELRADELSTARLMGDVDDLVELLSDGNGNYPVGLNPAQTPNNPVVRNFKRWNILGTYVWPNGYYADPSWIGNVNWMKTWIANRCAWMDTQFLPPPSFSVPPGVFTGSLQLAMTSTPVRPIYYTVDGSDPRLPGGGISPQAILYTGPLTITQNVRIKARIYYSGSWGAPADGIYALDDGLRITEIMYHPADASQPSPYRDEDFEFIELCNLGDKALDLSGVKFTKGIDFVFPSLVLDRGQRVVVAKDLGAFVSRYGGSIAVIGPYSGNLDNGGELLRLKGAFGQTIQEFKYNDWYAITDGEGFSLVALDPLAGNAALSTKEAWRPSERWGGAPGAEDPGLADDSIVINEIQSSTPDADWVELHNTTTEDIDISGWFLSNSAADLRKYQVQPNTIIPALGYYVFAQGSHFGNAGGPGVNTAFSFSERGDCFYLSSGYGGELGGYREWLDFGAPDGGLTFGRYNKTSGKSNFVTMSRPTPNEANAYPKVGPVVINEIMYNPAAGRDEFIELRNMSDTAVALYDPANPSNGWQFTAGVTFAFSAGNVIPANGYALVVGISPTTFRNKYGIGAEVPIYGPYVGLLDGAGETLELCRPGVPADGGYVPYIVVDRITYNDGDSWPTTPDGKGPSLGRIESGLYGNDYVNWAAELSGGSPGRVNFDRTPPTVQIVPVNPNPHDTPVRSITIVFDELVYNFDLEDLRLTYGDSTTNLLTTEQTLTDTGDGRTYVLENLAGVTWHGGNYTLRVVATDSYVVDISGNALVEGAEMRFGVMATVVAGLPTESNTFILKAFEENVLIFVNVPASAKPSYVISISELPVLKLVGGTGDDVLTIQSQLPMLPVFEAGGGTNQLNITTGLHSLEWDAGGMNVAVSGLVGAQLRLTSAQQIGRLSLTGDGSVSIATGGGKPLQVKSLYIVGDGVLDVGENDLVVQSGDLNAVRLLLRSGLGDGSWDGKGIRTSQSTGATGLGLGMVGTDVLVKYTWNGDANLDGVVDADDYFRIDSGFISQSGGYGGGDFNYDGVINADDYFMIDSAFIGQTAPLAGVLGFRRRADEDLFSTDRILPDVL